ncbi:MAG: CD1871A family CXXC motif-containing protein [Eubacteriales bacterium]|nr:CD1871A family CXXC motif-containing protein [Eubacteriales bacterium]
MVKHSEKAFHKGRILIPAITFLVGTVLVFAGISRGEMAVVLRKAIHICLECIGIG